MNTKYLKDKKAKNLALIFNSSFDDEIKQTVLYAYHLHNDIKIDERLFRKTNDKRFLKRAKVKKDMLFSLPDNIPVIFHHITGDNLITQPINRNDQLINFYN